MSFHWVSFILIFKDTIIPVMIVVSNFIVNWLLVILWITSVMCRREICCLSNCSASMQLCSNLHTNPEADPRHHKTHRCHYHHLTNIFNKPFYKLQDISKWLIFFLMINSLCVNWNRERNLFEADLQILH